MKTKQLADAQSFAADRGTGHGTAAWLLGLSLATITLLSPATLFAEILDDFNDAGLTAQRWDCQVLYGQGGYQVTNGQVQLFITPDGDHGFVNFSWRSNQFIVREGRTLELRVDLMSSSGDGAMARLGHVQDPGLPSRANYVLFFDQDTAAVVKRPESRQLLWLTNGPTCNVTNVKMVVALTGLPGGVVRIHTKVLDNAHGTNLLDRVFYDTPAADPLGAGTDNPPGNLLGLPCQFWLGLYHDNAGYIDPAPGIGHLEQAVVTLDNAEVFEYDSVWFSGLQTVACLPTWSENTAEAQIVVSANSPTSAVWTPWPEPIFKRFGQFSTVALTSHTEQYFKLVPGTQFFDDFSDAKSPFVNRNPWRHVSLPAEELVVTNGLLEVNWGGAERNLFAAIPPEPDIVVGDFYASVDILDWATDNSEFSYFGFGARFIRLPGGPLHGYGAGLVLRQAGVNQLWISYGGSSLDGPSFEMGEHPPPYRLELCGIGPNFSLRVIDLTTKQLIHEMRATEASRSQGMMGLQFYAPEGLAKSHHITLDNFFMTGTKP